jgi:diguanylate cyclase (GGDEF)-like protein
VITQEEADRIREQLLAVLAEDVHNTERLLARLDSITQETGIGAHAALLLILTHLAFEEDEARRHWKAILELREELTRALGRDAGVRVALLDYFMNANRKLTQPTIIDIEMLESSARNATLDPLTGLSTDRMFRTELQHELRRARRYEQGVSVVVFDLDDFAETNRRFGELVGDRLLREAAILVSNKVRDIDVAGRPGEDELALLLPETDPNGALLVAERIRVAVADFFAGRESDGQPVGLTVSAGVACYPIDASTAEDLLSRAAQALYEAKASGKNAVQLYRPERRRYLRIEMEPGRFEVEVLEPADRAPARISNLSRNGILFTSHEPLAVGEEIEVRLAPEAVGESAPSRRIRGRVVRLEELPGPQEVSTASPDRAPIAADRFEIGVAFDLDAGEGADQLVEFLERARSSGLGRP